MLSRAHAGQKRRQERQGGRLLGGAGRGRGRGRGGNGPPGGGRGGVNVTQRTNLHTAWNIRAFPHYRQFDHGDMWPIPGPTRDLRRVGRWDPIMNGTIPVQPWGAPNTLGNDLRKSNPVSLDYNELDVKASDVQNRSGEIQALWLRGNLSRWDPMGGPDPPALQINGRSAEMEAGWAFLGMANNMSYGLAWSCFYYALSDIYLGGPPMMSLMCIYFIEIMEDIKNVTGGIVTDNHRIRLSFEGFRTRTTDEQGTDYWSREYITCNSVRTVGALIQDPTLLLQDIVRAMASKDAFLFHRVYINVLTNIGGGGLQNMPTKFKQLRDGPFFKGSTGFFCIPDSGDGSCGLDAVIYGLSNALRRLQKHYASLQLAVPDLCSKFKNFRRFYGNGEGLEKAKSSKVKVLFVQTKAKLASYIGWKKGRNIQPEELCLAVRTFSEENKLDIGLLILDAINPLQVYYSSYNPSEEKVPSQIISICLWQFSGDDGEFNGHYDCINFSNIASWIKTRQMDTSGKKVKNTRTDLIYSPASFKLISSHESDIRGKFCFLCKHWQDDMDSKEWNEAHGGIQLENIFSCESCGVNFKSEKCFEKHLIQARHNSVTACDSQSMCEVCEKLHNRKYDCQLFYCEICAAKFPLEEKTTHICYMNYISPKKKGRIPLVLYSDTEGSRITGSHEAVCIATEWTELCATHSSSLKKQKPKCKACSLHSDSWGFFCSDCRKEEKVDPEECKLCHQSHYTYFEGESCLSEYFDWLSQNYMGSTVVFHNGGKYDLYMIYIEILSKGKFTVHRDAMRGSQIIFMTAYPMGAEGNRKGNQIRFIDSFYFISAPLRNFCEMFKLEDGVKGKFPYDLLNEKDWRKWNDVCPGYKYFGITDNEVENLEQVSDVRKKEIKSILNYINEEHKEGKAWNALEKLKIYTLQDVSILRQGCEIFRKNFWLKTNLDPFQWVTLPSAVAAAYRQPQFMPEKSIQIFSNADREWQRQGLRGGKCEVFVLYWKRTKPSEKIFMYDINSEYPFVQAFKHYPYGPITLDLNYHRSVSFVIAAKQFKRATGVCLVDVLQDDTGASGCGLIECEIQSGDAFFPILPNRVKTSNAVKNLFMNFSGRWIGYLNVLAAAVKHRQVIVTKIIRIQFWKQTSDTLFRNFLLTFYSEKVETSGWKKILNKSLEGKALEEAKEEFLTESERRGISINPDHVCDNPGKRATYKICLNCGWGYFCQKPHANENLFFNNLVGEDVKAMGELLDGLETDKDPRRLIGQPVQVQNYTRIRTTKAPEEITNKEMNKSIAYQVGGQVPAHGLVMISNAILSLDNSQPCYTDTDSIAYIYDSENKNHKMLPSGNYLGDFGDEFPDYDCTEWACCGPKSYFMRLEKRGDPSKVVFKGRFKGVPLNSSSYSLLSDEGKIASLGMQEMIDLIRDAASRLSYNEDEDTDEVMESDDVDQLSYTFHYTNFFKRGTDYKIRPTPEKKTVRFTFNKRVVIIPRDLTTGKIDPEWYKKAPVIRTKPKTDHSSELTREDIDIWWRDIKKKI